MTRELLRAIGDLPGVAGPWSGESFRGAHNAFPWTAELVELLGKVPDRAVAERGGISARAVAAKRRRRGIPPFQPKGRPVEWRADEVPPS
ncbi:MAG TPA: hypothetical protein VLF66_13870 [Thermoanaerobaculia bacterium]|nr:hypothetical protein [Thermoanaerobaculia bacterium]